MLRQEEQGACVGQKRQARRIDAARFWCHVDRSAGRRGCWPWMGSRLPDGYGKVRVGRRIEGAHRIALELKLGRRLRPGEHALHDPRSCNNPPCCNPRHLRAGGAKQNAADREISGTDRHSGPKGEAQAGARLSDEVVLEIIAGYRAASGWGAKGRFFDAMAARHGVSRRTIEYVAHGGTWTHVTQAGGRA